MSRKLNRNDSRAQRDRFYRDSDIKEKIEEQEAKVRLSYLNARLLSRLRTNGHIGGVLHVLQKHLWATTLFLAYSSLGVIYGDIGTSPLYVFSSIFIGEWAYELADGINGAQCVLETYLVG